MYAAILPLSLSLSHWVRRASLSLPSLLRPPVLFPTESRDSQSPALPLDIKNLDFTQSRGQSDCIVSDSSFGKIWRTFYSRAQHDAALPSLPPLPRPPPTPGRILLKLQVQLLSSGRATSKYQNIKIYNCNIVGLTTTTLRDNILSPHHPRRDPWIVGISDIFKSSCFQVEGGRTPHLTSEPAYSFHFTLYTAFLL